MLKNVCKRQKTFVKNLLHAMNKTKLAEDVKIRSVIVVKLLKSRTFLLKLRVKGNVYICGNSYDCYYYSCSSFSYFFSSASFSFHPNFVQMRSQ